MRQKWKVVTFHGVPSDHKIAMTELSDRSSKTKGTIYGEAIESLSDTILNGDLIDVFPAAHRTHRYSVRLLSEVDCRANQAIKSSNLRIEKSAFLREAIRKYLTDIGYLRHYVASTPNTFWE